MSRNVLPFPKDDQEKKTFVVELNRQLDEIDSQVRFLRSVAVAAGGAGHIITNGGLDLTQRSRMEFSGGVEASDSAGGTGATKVQRSALSGDVAASAGSGTTTIQSDAVSFAKMANLATDRLIGRDTAGTGDPEALTVSGGVEFTGSGGIQTSAFTGDATKTAGGTAMTIQNDTVTYAKMQNVSATDKVLGRSTAGAGDVEEIPCTAFARTLLDDADATTARTTLGITAGGSKVQAAQVTNVSENATTSEVTLLSGTIVGTLTLPAGFFVAGKLLRVVVRGSYDLASGQTTFNLYLGATPICTLAIDIALAGADSSAELWALCRTVGATGKIAAEGQLRINDSAAGYERCVYAPYVESTIDTTATNALDFTLQSNVTAAGNSYTCTMFVADYAAEP